MISNEIQQEVIAITAHIEAIWADGKINLSDVPELVGLIGDVVKLIRDITL